MTPPRNLLLSRFEAPDAPELGAPDAPALAEPLALVAEPSVAADGLAEGALDLALRQLLGEEAPLSARKVARLRPGHFRRTLAPPTRPKAARGRRSGMGVLGLRPGVAGTTRPVLVRVV